MANKSSEFSFITQNYQASNGFTHRHLRQGVCNSCTPWMKRAFSARPSGLGDKRKNSPSFCHGGAPPLELTDFHTADCDQSRSGSLVLTNLQQLSTVSDSNLSHPLPPFWSGDTRRGCHCKTAWKPTSAKYCSSRINWIGQKRSRHSHFSRVIGASSPFLCLVHMTSYDLWSPTQRETRVPEGMSSLLGTCMVANIIWERPLDCITGRS